MYSGLVDKAMAICFHLVGSGLNHAECKRVTGSRGKSIWPGPFYTITPNYWLHQIRVNFVAVAKFSSNQYIHYTYAVWQHHALVSVELSMVSNRIIIQLKTIKLYGRKARPATAGQRHTNNSKLRFVSLTPHLSLHHKFNQPYLICHRIT